MSAGASGWATLAEEWRPWGLRSGLWRPADSHVAGPGIDSRHPDRIAARRPPTPPASYPCLPLVPLKGGLVR